MEKKTGGKMRPPVLLDLKVGGHAKKDWRQNATACPAGFEGRWTYEKRQAAKSDRLSYDNV